MNDTAASPTRHHAEPVAEYGPAWSRAGDDALRDWIETDCNLWDRDPSIR